jgi:hypothetical protein
VRGSQDIATVVKKHLKDNAFNHKHILLYSDRCCGQNINIKMLLTLLKLVHDPDILANIIDHRFMVSGHLFLSNDSEFGLIESASKKVQHIYIPEDWVQIIKSSKQKNPHLKVINMKREEFLSTKTLEEAITNRKKTADG